MNEIKESARDRFDRGQPIVILHVEDDPAHAELVRRGFEEHNRPCEIHHIDNGPQALELLHRQGGSGAAPLASSPDVVLLDLRLPGMDGLEILDRIRAHERTKNLPVIVLTTSEAEADKLSAYGSKINAYIVKPLDFDSFGVLLDVIYLVLTR